jgi:hypothetical protein
LKQLSSFGRNCQAAVWSLTIAFCLAAAHSLSAQGTADCAVPNPLPHRVGCQVVNCAHHHAEYLYEQYCSQAGKCDNKAVLAAYRQASVAFSWFDTRSDFTGFVKKVGDREGASYLGCSRQPRALLELTRGALAEGAHMYSVAYDAYVNCSKKPAPGEAADEGSQRACAAKAIELYCVIHSENRVCQTAGGQQTMAMTIVRTTTTSTTGNYEFDSAVDASAPAATPKPETTTITVKLPARGQVAALRSSMTPDELSRLEGAVTEKKLALAPRH